MDILIAGCIIAVLICGIGVCIAFIMGIKDDLKWGLRENERLEHDVDWWQDYCDKIVEEHKETLNEHEERLESLQSKIKDLEREIDAKNDEILLLKKKILEKDSKPMTLEEVCQELGWQAGQEILKEANELRAATKDLDFPPTDKVDSISYSNYYGQTDMSDAFKKFLDRQSKAITQETMKEDENNG